MAAQEWKGQEVSSIYFGGGTPSQIETSQLGALIQKLRDEALVPDGIEITVECNPDDLTDEYLDGLLGIGVTRLSVGVQSFQDHHLKSLNRNHDAGQANKALDLAMGKGFTSISADLMFAIPGMTIDELESNANGLMETGIQHISIYGLTIEKGTPLHYQIQKDKTEEVDEAEYNQQFELIHRLLQDGGFEHYEISNFCQKGHRAVHNSNYWRKLPFVGFGPSAHGFTGQDRYRVRPNWTSYVDEIESGNRPIFWDRLSATDKFNETIMLSLRTSDGLDMNKLREQDSNLFVEFDKKLAKTRAKLPSCFNLQGDVLRLNLDGMKLSDHLSSELFVE